MVVAENGSHAVGSGTIQPVFVPVQRGTKVPFMTRKRTLTKPRRGERGQQKIIGGLPKAHTTAPLALSKMVPTQEFVLIGMHDAKIGAKPV